MIMGCLRLLGISMVTAAIVFQPLDSVAANPNLIPVKQDGRYGHITSDGKVAVAPQFDYAGPFFEGLAAVRTDEGKWGYIDTSGAFRIEPVYGHASDFGQGLALVEQGGKFGYVDTDGTMVISPRFDGGGAFAGGLASVTVGGKSGYIDTRGEFVIEPKFDGAEGFHEGLARICAVPPGEACHRSDRRRFGFINKRGEIVIPARFEYAEHFADGLAMARVDGRYGFIDKTGQWAIAPDYTNAAMAFSEGLARVTTAQGESTFIDREGNTVLTAPVYTGDLFSEGLVITRDPATGTWGYLDKSGKMAIPARFDRALGFKDGIAPAMKEGKWGLINREGAFVAPPRYDRIGPLY